MRTGQKVTSLLGGSCNIHTVIKGERDSLKILAKKNEFAVKCDKTFWSEDMIGNLPVP